MVKDYLNNDDVVVVLAEPGTTESGFILEPRGSVDAAVPTDTAFHAETDGPSPETLAHDFPTVSASTSKITSPSSIGAAFNVAASGVTGFTSAPVYAPQFN